MKSQVSVEDFAKLDLRVGQVVEAHEVELSRNLLELIVDFGGEIGQRKIYAGIRKWYPPEKLVGRKLAFVVNLAPKTFRIRTARKSSRTLRSSASPAGLWEIKEYTSEGMMMAAAPASAESFGEVKEAVLYTFDKDLELGTILR